jgi:hypothetical protein
MDVQTRGREHENSHCLYFCLKPAHAFLLSLSLSGRVWIGVDLPANFIRDCFRQGPDLFKFPEDSGIHQLTPLVFIQCMLQTGWFALQMFAKAFPEGVGIVVPAPVDGRRLRLAAAAVAGCRVVVGGCRLLGAVVAGCRHVAAGSPSFFVRLPVHVLDPLE